MERKLLDCDWTILKTLWGEKPLAMKNIIANVRERQPEIKWSYKTYHTYLRVMLEKGLIGCEILSARDKLYFPLISREDALKAESESLFSRVSMDSMGRLVAMMAREGQLSDKDRQELTALFVKLDKKDGDKNGG
jgi:BlaI family transcriptional regulator, penicillinase repressor